MVKGRPTKYKKEYNELAYKLALLGATDKEMSDILNVSESTLNLWKQKEPEFSESIKKGKVEADAEIAQSLYKRALGYTYEEEKTEQLTNGKKRITIICKEVPADIAAINIWLKNRRSKVNENEGIRWADKHEHSGSIKINDLSDVPTEELIKRAEAVKKIIDE
jgi:hypothetical protein